VKALAGLHAAARDRPADLLDARRLAAPPAGQDAQFAMRQAVASVASQGLTRCGRGNYRS
jgi:hypothetical protein